MPTKLDDKSNQELGNKLRKAREKLGYTQADIAEKSDMTVNYYAMIERGEVNPTLDKIRKVLKFLKLKTSDIPE